MSKSFAVIGDPIDHSLSPNIHSAAFREMDLDSSYIAYRIPKGELAEGIEGLKKIKIDGFNITIPHKIEMMKYLDKIDESCSLIGAVNTVSNKDGVLKGYNTDMDGFLEPFKKKELKIVDTKVLLIGAGGAARAIVAGFAKEKAKSITIANRTLEKAENLSEFAKSIGKSRKSFRICKEHRTRSKSNEN
jgi:shikimate dehydrogenase